MVADVLPWNNGDARAANDIVRLNTLIAAIAVERDVPLLIRDTVRDFVAQEIKPVVLKSERLEALDRSLPRLFGVAGLMPEARRLDGAAMGPDQQPILGHSAQVAPQGDLGRAEDLGHLRHGDHASRADALRYQAPPLDREHSPDGTPSIIFDQ